MPRFIAIDGLRAWMAWLVVTSHVGQLGMAAGNDFWTKLDLGGHAVNTFIIISGFVITHLLIERPGGYLPYIIPRFMRLFPAFAACSAIGLMCYAAAARWADPAWFAEHFGGAYYQAMFAYLPQHAAAHLTMLHGLIPNTLLPSSQYAFLPPGWSVSLEWQFYLVAPFVLWLCATRNRAVMLVLGVVLCSLIYHFALKEFWERPSVLIGTAKFFLVGIGCRIAAPTLAGSVRYVAATGLGLGFTALWAGSPPLAMWAVIYSFMLQSDRPVLGVDRPYVAAMRALFESRPAQILAERSYSTYLLHWPVIMTIGVIGTSAGVRPGPELVAVMLLAFPLTLVLQEPIYRLIEVPGRALGKRWARSLGAKATREVPQESIDGGVHHALPTKVS